MTALRSGSREVDVLVTVCKTKLVEVLDETISRAEEWGAADGGGK